jgi:hypothetical protein
VYDVNLYQPRRAASTCRSRSTWVFISRTSRACSTLARAASSRTRARGLRGVGGLPMRWPTPEMIERAAALDDDYSDLFRVLK